MAGKTLTGIGEDDSGRLELELETATPILAAHDADRSERTQVDDDKVAEGLKKLRSLDEPLGLIPSSMPTLREGMPAVGATPTPLSPASFAAAAAAEAARARGTSHGHAQSAGGGIQASVPMSVDDRMKGTLLGHTLHLPDLPAEGSVDESRPAEVREIARTVTPSVIVPASITSDFGHGDARFFDAEGAGTDEYEPENPRGKVMARIAIFFALASAVGVAAIAWVRVHRVDAAPPVEANTTPAAPSTADNPSGLPVRGAPAEGAPAAQVPEPAAVVAPPPAAAAPPEPPPVAPTPEEAPKPFAAPADSPVAPAPPRTHARHHEPPGLAAQTPPPPRAVNPIAKPTAKTTASGGKRAKDEDPDGTLPLSD